MIPFIPRPYSYTLVLSLLGFIVLRFVFRRSQRLPLPPGPRPLPLIGNLLDFPKHGFDWLVYAEWGRLHGPVVSATSFGTTLIVINDYGKAIELLDRRSAKYSSRPWVPMLQDMLGWGAAFTIVPYGPRLRSYRKYFHQLLGSPQSVSAFDEHQEFHIKQFVRSLRYLVDSNQEDAGNRIEQLCFALGNGFILDVAYGYTLQDKDDPVVQAAQDAIQVFVEACSPGKFLVNQFPILKYVPEWMPGARFKRLARQWSPLFEHMNDVPFNIVKSQLAAGTAKESFTSKWLEQNIPLQEEDYTSITIHLILLMLTQYPQVQSRLHDEIDARLSQRSPHALPTTEDISHLPYLNAVVKECMRLHPAAPYGLPHSTTEEDVVDGWRIPKGSVIYANIWQMCRDPTLYHDPEDFFPDRFLGDDPEMDPSNIVYGFGRRICPGKYLADAIIHRTLATVVALVNLRPFRDAQDNIVLPEAVGTGNITNRLLPFPCKIVPRTVDRWRAIDVM